MTASECSKAINDKYGNVQVNTEFTSNIVKYVRDVFLDTCGFIYKYAYEVYEAETESFTKEVDNLEIFHERVNSFITELTLGLRLEHLDQKLFTKFMETFITSVDKQYEKIMSGEVTK